LGLVSSAIFSTHLSRCLLALRGRVTVRTGFIVSMAIFYYDGMRRGGNFGMRCMQ
jgi:hypothetical protein